MHLGLRGRVVAALAVVSAITLGVAAFTLLSPLQQRLRDNALEGLSQTLRDARGTFAALPDDAFAARDRRLLRTARALRRRSGAEIGVLTAGGRLLVDTDPEQSEPYLAARGALRPLVTGAGSQAEAEAAVRVAVGEQDVILAARRRIDDVQDVTGVVTRAFTSAAVAGLIAALVAGLLLAGRLARRIRRLRDTALRVAEIGPVAELQADDGRDEVGDLSRAFATMQERLREQEHARRTFVATASHELRTPLSSLQVMLDMLIDDLDADPVAVESARVQARSAEQQAERLSALARELLDLSRIDAGLPLRAELVDLGAVLRAVSAELDVRLADDARTVELDVADGSWGVGDPGSVAQILRILLDNALRHTAAPGSIQATVRLRDGMAVISVQDHGPGVPVADRERIFERFARGARATDGGFGLGLAIGRDLARRMGGDLTLEDSPAGARFTLSLCAAPAP